MGGLQIFRDNQEKLILSKDVYVRTLALPFLLGSVDVRSVSL